MVLQLNREPLVKELDLLLIVVNVPYYAKLLNS
jgi:hypothetical protein